MTDLLDNACSYLREKGIGSLQGAVSTGSGQSLPLDTIPQTLECSYTGIPGLGASSIPGHPGLLRIVEGSDGAWAIWTGRRHFYEGLTYAQIGFYIDISRALGAKYLLCVNAAGGLSPGLAIGDLVTIRRFRNFIPLPSEPVHFDGGPWREMSVALARRLQRSGELAGIPLKEGSYVGVPGPTTETAAEVAWLRSLGCDVVGMSTTPELVRAKELGMEAIALSQVTNVHGEGERLTHKLVVKSGEEGSPSLSLVVAAFLTLGE